ncbi:AtpZ/AtpI family protein [Beijerinckia mobilis]|uniref:AtpZ/AtpI family protein n=1 Tax=Beijerinckia mobilis TaxID=231434 RepID=UPI000A03FA53|nr:AtpZ/AtpI family protein [Beijerinckia mobilis]
MTGSDPNADQDGEGKGAASGDSGDRLVKAAHQAAERVREGMKNPEPSLGARLGQIGVLGWTIVIPTLLAMLVGRALDHYFGTGIFFSAPFIMIGAGMGFWSAWKWMHRP